MRRICFSTNVKIYRRGPKEFLEEMFSSHNRNARTKLQPCESRGTSRAPHLRRFLHVQRCKLSRDDLRGSHPARPYFPPFVNNGDVNCGDRLEGLSDVPWRWLHSRETSVGQLRLPSFKTHVNGTSCRVEEKRETRDVSDTRQCG